MRFWKMNGAGNDFLILNDLEEQLPEAHLPQIARTLCHRQLSIGADGLMVVKPPRQGGDYRMLFYNSDGSLGEMCGNGARCICRYGYEMGLAGERQTVETTAGIVTGQRMDRRLYRIRLNDPTVVKLDYPVEAGGVTYPCAYVELGDPASPMRWSPSPACGRLRSPPSGSWAGRCAGTRPFPGAPTSISTRSPGRTGCMSGPSSGAWRTLTYACGTGTGSVVTVLTLLGKVSGRNVRADMTGGQLIVDAEQAGGRIADLYLTGPTNLVAKGEVTDEDWSYDYLCVRARRTFLWKQDLLRKITVLWPSCWEPCSWAL